MRIRFVTEFAPIRNFVPESDAIVVRTNNDRLLRWFFNFELDFVVAVVIDFLVSPDRLPLFVHRRLRGFADLQWACSIALQPQGGLLDNLVSI